MRTLFLSSGRFLAAAYVLLPIYLGYFWLWFLWRKLGRKIPREKWSAKHAKNAQKFYRLAVKLRGGMIKIGQLISARVDIMPREWTDGLSKLQDKVDPTPWEGIRDHLTQQYGEHPEQVFEDIEEKCIAAASFGQVHRATTKKGERIALKIRYPGIQAKLKADMTFMKFAVPLFNIFIPKVDLKVIYREMRLALETELDYGQEAAYTRRIHDNFEGVPQIFIPRVIDEYTTDSVIATQFFEGYKVNDKERMAELEVEPKELLVLVLKTWTKMMYEDGVFQSDPHPGNLLFNKIDGETTLCVIDFGQVKILPRDFHGKLVQSVLAFIQRDVDQFAASIATLGLLSEADVEKCKPLLKEFFEQYYELTPEEAKRLDFERIREDVQGLIKQIDGVNIPTDLILYGRTFGLLAGLGSALDDSQNLVVLAQPFIMQSLAKSMAQGLGAPQPTAAA